MTDDALPQLLPLLKSDNQSIRDGIQALLWQRLQRLKSSSETGSKNWTATQLGKRHALRKLLSVETTLQQVGNDKDARHAVNVFHDYAMQWW